MKKECFRGKLGQQSNWFMIILVLAVITLIVVALALTGSFEKIANIFGQASDLEIVAQACSTYAANNLATSYCNEFKKVEINGKNQYASCNYLKTNNLAVIEGSMSCADVSNAKKINFCINENLKKGDLVNGFDCGRFELITGECQGDLSGTWKNKCEPDQVDLTSVVNDTSKDLNEGFCCISEADFASKFFTA